MEVRAGLAGVIGRGMLAMFRYDATAVLPGVSVPTLVVVGGRDNSCTPEAGEFISRSVPGARLLRLAEARHCGLYEFHGDFDAAVEDFVDRCARPFGAAQDPAAQTTRAAQPGHPNPA